MPNVSVFVVSVASGQGKRQQSISGRSKVSDVRFAACSCCMLFWQCTNAQLMSSVSQAVFCISTISMSLWVLWGTPHIHCPCMMPCNSFMVPAVCLPLPSQQQVRNQMPINTRNHIYHGTRIQYMLLGSETVQPDPSSIGRCRHKLRDSSAAL